MEGNEIWVGVVILGIIVVLILWTLARVALDDMLDPMAWVKRDTEEEDG